MIQLQEIERPPAELRRAYLQGLPEAQSLFLEEKVSAGRCSLLGAGRPLGYVVHADDALLELHLEPLALPHLLPVFQALVAQLGLKRALCKSFDPTLLFACQERPATVRTVGLLYRDLVDTPPVEAPAVQARLGRTLDAPAVLAINDGFFADEHEITAYAASDGLMLYRRAGDLIGCGLIRRTVPELRDCDIGVYVAPDYRRQGHGAQIVRHMKGQCLGRGLRPAAGCAVDNALSQSCLERGGFAARHRLLEFSW